LAIMVWYYFYPLDTSEIDVVQERSRFHAAFVEAGILFMMPFGAAALIHAFVIYPATVFTFKKGE